MPVPKRKTSKSRKNKRRAGNPYRISLPVPCPHCHQPRSPHRVCPHCGYYNGRPVMPGEEI